MVSLAAGDRVIRVVPDVVGMDKEFDYLLPSSMAGAAQVEVGSMVRVALGGRRVGAWVVALDVAPPAGVALRPVAKVRGLGPAADLVDLATWAAWRWAGHPAHFLRTASPERAIKSLPAPAPVSSGSGAPAERVELPAEWGSLPQEAWAGGTRVVRLPPAADLTPLVAATAVRHGPTVVAVPTASRVAVLAGRLRRRGLSVAVMPDDWAQARAGCDVVVGTRAVAWAPCPNLAAVVVVDAHDESLGQESVPTWQAVDVLVERARRSSVPCVLVSPCPTLELLELGPVVTASRNVERSGWAPLEVLDRRGDDPRLGLWSERLVRVISDTRRVALVLNRRGRGRLLACGACGELARCERCGAAVAQEAEPAGRPEEAKRAEPAEPTGVAARQRRSAVSHLACRACDTTRPPVCLACGSTRLKLLRVGVTRAAEELEALIGRPVTEVSGASSGPTEGEVSRASTLIGTEAVLHRAGPLDAVVFVDFDQDLLAPRVRASEDALAMLAAASRLVGGRRRDGRVLVQTRQPDHPVLQAAVAADPTAGQGDQLGIRRDLRLPPAAATAAIWGPEAGDYVKAMRAGGLEVLGPNGDRWLAKAEDHAALADALAAQAGFRPGGVKVAVDPRRV